MDSKPFNVMEELYRRQQNQANCKIEHAHEHVKKESDLDHFHEDLGKGEQARETSPDSGAAHSGYLCAERPNPYASAPFNQIRAGKISDTGVPNAYPIAHSVSIDRTRLRPLQQPLFDTEFYPKDGCEKIQFFQRPIGQTFAHNPEAKERVDTNINQSSMLDYPREFSILGFSLSYDKTMDAGDRDALINDGVLSFFFSGNRDYLTIPLTLMPNSEVKSEISLSPETGLEKMEKKINKLTDMVKALLGEKADLEHADVGYKSAPYHRFNLGRSALKIKPGEAFGIRVEFGHAPKIKKPCKLVAAMHGLMWMPL